MERCPHCNAPDAEERARRRLECYNIGFDKGVEAAKQWEQMKWLFERPKEEELCKN